VWGWGGSTKVRSLEAAGPVLRRAHRRCRITVYPSPEQPDLRRHGPNQNLSPGGRSMTAGGAWNSAAPQKRIFSALLELTRDDPYVRASSRGWGFAEWLWVRDLDGTGASVSQKVVACAHLCRRLAPFRGGRGAPAGCLLSKLCTSRQVSRLEASEIVRVGFGCCHRHWWRRPRLSSSRIRSGSSTAQGGSGLCASAFGLAGWVGDATTAGLQGSQRLPRDFK